VPASRWQPSPRPYPQRITAPEYPAKMEVRRVSAVGTFLWNIVYYRTLLGRIDESNGKIIGV
jgi:hypothetical protein